MAGSSSSDSARRLPPLAPAPPGASSQQSQNVKVSKGPRVNACNTCRVRKIKCNGARPTCDKCCTTPEIPCVYSETQSREARRKYLELRDRRNTHEEMIELLKSLPETDALEVLRLLRSGGEVKQILESAREGDLLLQLSSTQRKDGRCALSYIADMTGASSSQDLESPESGDAALQDSESVASTTGSTGADRNSLV